MSKIGYYRQRMFSLDTCKSNTLTSLICQCSGGLVGYGTYQKPYSSSTAGTTSSHVSVLSNVTDDCLTRSRSRVRFSAVVKLIGVRVNLLPNFLFMCRLPKYEYIFSNNITVLTITLTFFCSHKVMDSGARRHVGATHF